jgi:hypothetical protein
MVLLLFLVCGGRRLEHLKYLSADGLLPRLAWLRRLPSHPTISRFLAACRSAAVKALRLLNAQFVVGCLRRLGTVFFITLDLDGTVISTRGHQERTRKGYNPIRRGARSYRPLTVHVAETGQFLDAINRPGDAGENRGAVALMRGHIRRLRSAFPKAAIRTRQDSAFFDDKLLAMYEDEGVGYVVLAKAYEDLTLIVKQRRPWQKIREGVEAFEFCWKMKKWQRARDFVVYRFKLSAKEIAERRGEQLDLFRPTDPQHRYMIFCHNLTREECDTDAMHAFYGGRGGQEKDLGELKSSFAFDVLPSRKYSGNGLWQQMCLLAYNTTVGFATEVVAGARRRRKHMKAKATRVFQALTARTLRFLHFCVPGHVVNTSGTPTLRLPESRARQTDWECFRQRIESIETRRKRLAA